ncbi:MAG: hypothetical protein Q4B15_07815 [Lachnospiraceae bacterium]|nr:hypothetical protein [Lachnospiraceae bacterium]
MKSEIDASGGESETDLQRPELKGEIDVSGGKRETDLRRPGLKNEIEMRKCGGDV